MNKRIKAILLNISSCIDGIECIHVRPDYTERFGHDKKTMYMHPYVLQRRDFILNYALEQGMLDDCDYVLISDSCNITKADIDILVQVAENNNAGVSVPLSNRGREEQKVEVCDKIEYYAYLDLSCCLINTSILKKIGGYERKFCHIQKPELFFETYFISFPYYDMDFCIKLWQAGYSTILARNVKVVFEKKFSQNYNHSQITGGQDAILFYRQLDVHDIEFCGEGQVLIHELLKIKRKFKEPNIQALTEVYCTNKKLVLIVHSGYMMGVKREVSTQQFSISDPSKDIIRFISYEMDSREYDIQLAQEELLDKATVIVFMIYFEDTYSVSNRMFEVAYTDKWMKIAKERKLKTILVAVGEPVFSIPNFFDKSKHSAFDYVLTQNKSFVDNKKYFYSPLISDYNFVSSEGVPYRKKKLLTYCCQYYSRQLKDNRCLYPDRLKLVEYMDKYHAQDFEFYGYGFPSNKYSCYKGAVTNRFEIFKNHKFVITIPNYIHSVHEFFDPRIMEAFVVGSIPIYLGCPDIYEIVPSDTFIDLRNFKDFECLFEYINGMDEVTYCGYIERIEEFLSSDVCRSLDRRAFIGVFADVLEKI